MPAKTPFLREESALRRRTRLSFPETVEEFPWGHPVVKVKGKVFLFISLEEQFLSLSVKLPLSGTMALTLPCATPSGYGLYGKSGWVTARFGPTEKVPLHMLKESVDESFRAVAPKLLASVDAADGEPEPLRHRSAGRNAPDRSHRSDISLPAIVAHFCRASAFAALPCGLPKARAGSPNTHTSTHLMRAPAFTAHFLQTSQPSQHGRANGGSDSLCRRFMARGKGMSILTYTRIADTLPALFSERASCLQSGPHSRPTPSLLRNRGTLLGYLRNRLGLPSLRAIGNGRRS